MKNGYYSVETRTITDQYTKEENYWLNKLSGQLMKFTFPYDFPTETQGDDFREDVVEFAFNGEIFKRLMRLSNGSDLRLHMIFTAVLNLLLARYTGAADIIVGAPILKKDIEGEFINTVLILRNQLHRDMTFKELLLGVRQCVTEAVENVNYPLETLLYKLNMPFSGKDFPLFDIVVLVENIHDINYIRHTSPNMIFSIRKTRQTVAGKLVYNCRRYSRETVEHIACHFTRAVANALVNPHLPLEKLDIMSPGEKEQLLTGFNQNHHPYPQGKTLHQLFAEQAERTPDHIVLLGETSKHKDPCGQSVNASGEIQLSYRQLNEKSDGLALLLKDKGVGLETIVGLIIERSTAMIISIFGILKAGGAYLPIDPAYPEERINYMLADSSAKILVTSPGLSEKLEKLLLVNCQLLTVNEIPPNRSRLNNATGEASSHLRLPPAPPTSLAYVIYTSGSTGRPKGVMVEHPSVVNLVTWHASNFKLNIDTHVALLSDYTFDVSVEDIFSTLIHGCTLYIPLKETEQDKDRLIRYINERQINVINFIPSVLKELLSDNKKPGCLHIVVSGGEKLDNRLKDRLIAKKYRLYNCYGPTETTVDALCEKCSDQKVSLGKPIYNTRAYILGINQLYFQPIGVPGELCLAGAGLARGYLDHVEMTNEKFIHHPFIGGERIYRTGDLVRRLPHGNIEFLDRLDNQVKIMGIRIELGEVENQLLTDPQVKEVVVLVKEEKNGRKNLCAYIVPINKALFSVPRLKKYLQQRLPSYMIPTYFVCLDHIPLTTNGKVDRKALSEPEIERQPDYTPPRNKLERRLLEIWSEVLAIEKDKIGIDSNLFDLGGNSLIATKLLQKTQKEFNVEILLCEFLRTLTIRRLAEDIASSQEA